MTKWSLSVVFPRVIPRIGGVLHRLSTGCVSIGIPLRPLWQRLRLAPRRAVNGPPCRTSHRIARFCENCRNSWTIRSIGHHGTLTGLSTGVHPLSTGSLSVSVDERTLSYISVGRVAMGGLAGDTVSGQPRVLGGHRRHVYPGTVVPSPSARVSVAVSTPGRGCQAIVRPGGRAEQNFPAFARGDPQES